MDDTSITKFFHKLRDGDEFAAQKLWETYFASLVVVARRKLEGRRRLVGDEEDVALSAFNSFCRAAELGRFPQLNDRSDLWNVLVTITLNKAIRLMRDEARQKRGGNHTTITSSSDDTDCLAQIIGTEPSPAIAAQVVEEIEVLLLKLPSPELIELAQLKMEGYTNAEIAERWEKTERTVERKLNLIRKIWDTESHAPK
jgi:RNA polymerase sigma factor (sigma-70 family)